MFEIGDRVEIVLSQNQPQLLGEITTIYRVRADHWHPYEVDIIDPSDGKRWCYPAECLRKIDDDDNASWDRIEEITQWNPTKINALPG